MNIALIVHDLGEDWGQGRYARVLADELSGGHEVTVFGNTCVRPAGSRWKFHPVRAVRANALTCVYTFPLGLRLVADLVKRFEIRHAQGYCGGRPNVVTAHMCVTAYLSCLPEISWRSHCSLELMALAEARFYRRYSGVVIATSQRVAQGLRDFYGVRRPIYVVPHGVDTERFSSANRERLRAKVRAEMGVAGDETLALYVGDLTKAHAGLKRLAEAVRDVRLAIVTGSRQYRWLARNVQFLRPTSEIERYYAAADALVFPTSYDAFGMVVLEAMASGLAVFTSDRAGAAELIDSGKNGFVVPLEYWVEATRAGLRDPELLQSIGRVAEQSAQQHSWHGVVREVERIYHEVAASGG